MIRQRPPRLAEWLLARSLPRAERDVQLGDLHEEFADRIVRDGDRSAVRWYRRQVRGSMLANIRRRLTFRPTARHPLRGIMQDLRFAFRSLRSTPTFTAVALIVLTLGIGATTAIFSVVDAVVLRGVPFPHGSRLVVLTEPRSSAGGGGAAVPYPDFADWREQQHTFDDLAAFAGSRLLVVHDGGSTESLRAGLVTSNLFTVLGVNPAHGRAFAPDDLARSQRPVAILSDAFWRRRFNGDPAAVGRTITAEDGTYDIVGVMPAGFVFPIPSTRAMDIWTPYVPAPGSLQRGSRRTSNLQVVGRLKNGLTLSDARMDIEVITARLKTATPSWFNDRGVAVETMQDSIVGSAKAWMMLLLASVSFVLLIACVNVANLLLARGAARARDVAVRAALGASRWRILRGLFVENLVLSITGSVLGVALAVWGVQILRATLPPSLPRLDEIAVNYRVLFAAALAAVTVAAVVTPIWQPASSGLATSLRHASRSGAAGVARRRLRTGLLIAEVALAVVLLVGSGLFISSFVTLLRVDLGFDVDRILSIDLSPTTRIRGADMSAVAAPISAAFDRVQHLSGLEASALVSGTPPLLTGSDRSSVTVPGKPAFTDPDDAPDDKGITSDYFKVLGVPLRAGRFFTDADALDGAAPVVILNDVAATRYFGNDNPIGVPIGVSGIEGEVTVVGVVRGTRLQGPEAERRPEIYLPLNWRHGRGSPIVMLLMRTTGAPAAFAPVARSAIQSAAPGITTPAAVTYAELFSRIVAQRKFNMILLMLFGGLAITIAAAGIYGVMAYLVEQRTQEIGVRLALGAHPSRVLRMVLQHAAACLAVGLALGLVSGWMLSRFVQSFLFRIDAHDLRVYLAASVVLMAAGLAAALVPARRAARVDPVIALRAQ